MATSSILNIGRTGLNAALIGINTTGHNIANAASAGYSRQVLVQTAGLPQITGAGFIGQGTEVDSIRRIYNELTARQVMNSQATSSGLGTQLSQISQINNMLSDALAGLTPVLQDFFSSINDLAASPSDPAARQAMLSTAESLAGRFQGMGQRLQELNSGVNAQLTSSVDIVNTYARQIASLNDAISSAANSTGHPPNDLLDQRDQLILELNKQVKASVVVQDGNIYNVFIGNGIPLVSGSSSFALATVNAAAEPGRLEIAYAGNQSVLGADTLTGGMLGGLLAFRRDALDGAINQLGQVASAIAYSFNQQHRQALDAQGQPGGDFFSVPAPLSLPSRYNAGDAVVATSIGDVSRLTTSDYRLDYDGSNYTLTRLSDGETAGPFAAGDFPLAMDGLSIAVSSGSMASGDYFVIKPTAAAAAGFGVAIQEIARIATGSPAVTAGAAAGNGGSGAISAPQVAAGYAASPLAAAFTLSFDGVGNSLSGFPAGEAITVTTPAGATVSYPAGSAIAYVDGATVTVAGVSFVVSGAPADGDQFSVTPVAANAPGDNRNALLLAALQTANTMNDGTGSYQDSFNQLVSRIGTKTRELQITSAAEGEILNQALLAQQSESGVNLDEEAANLLRYQQAYQAAGKVMQIAGELFDVLLSIHQ